MEPYARYRAPAESGRKLVSPPWRELGALAGSNRTSLAASSLEIAGQPVAEFAAEARQELLSVAVDYVATYAEGRRHTPAPRESNGPLILTGHQPELVHPGVWVKNFAAAHLAHAAGGVALNLVIDADACRGTTLRVPSGDHDQPAFAFVEFDHPSKVVPWEERSIIDEGLWRSFPDRVQQGSSTWLSERMLDAWWPLAMNRAAATGRIGTAFAQGRHLAELAWDQDSLELPQSLMCQTRAFRRFIACILGDLPRFADAYNGALDDYRRAHRIRNHAHPVSNLTADGDWRQAPLWAWSAAKPQRRAVYVRQSAAGLEITDRAGWQGRLPSPCDSRDAAAFALAEIEAQGIKLRSRALLTTMFARLAVADLFIHGIGGAKYDEATDAIIQRFFHVDPPAFATISGTLRLPLEAMQTKSLDATELRRELRELQYHPERHLGSGSLAAPSEAKRLIAEKRHWINLAKTTQNARERHLAIANVNEALRPLVAGQRKAVEDRLQAALRQTRAARVLQSREYAFCLFPRQVLARFLLDFSPGVL